MTGSAFVYIGKRYSVTGRYTGLWNSAFIVRVWLQANGVLLQYLLDGANQLTGFFF